MWNFPLLPEQASTFAAQVDPIFWFLTIFVGGFTIGLTLVLIGLGVKYQQVPGSGRKTVHIHNMKAELSYAALVTVIAVGLFFWGANVYTQYAYAPDNTIDINVIGKQWMWKLQHPNGMREVNELHIPVGRPVKLTMTSQDVIHDFYIPAFRVKQDVLPARYTTLWFEATKVGEFPLFCAEYCGTEHSTMGGTVHVMKAEEYQQWLDGGVALTPVAAGEALFNQMGCATCHASGDASRGPVLNGIFAHEAQVNVNGKLETVTVDEEYLRESIISPALKVVDGYSPLMPAFKSQLSDEDVINLIAYIKSLGDADAS